MVRFLCSTVTLLTVWREFERRRDESKETNRSALFIVQAREMDPEWSSCTVEGDTDPVGRPIRR